MRCCGRSACSSEHRRTTMARPIWKGMISFGLVSVPVSLYPAEQSHQLAFSMLDKRDFSPVGYKRYNKTTGKEVPWKDIVKGYEYEKDQYVVLSDEDFRRANVQQAKSVDIATFVDAGSHPAAILRDALLSRPRRARQEGVCAAARDDARRRQGRRRPGRHPHDASPGRGRAVRRSAADDHDALRQPDSRAYGVRISVDVRQVSRRHGEGNGTRPQADRRHGRPVEARGVRGHVQRRPDAADQGEGEGG